MRSTTRAKVFYVYVDYRLDVNTPFYVGKGTLARIRYLKRNQIHSHIVAKHGMRREVILASKDHDFIIDEEIRLIALLHTRDTFGGANLTDGGEGTLGWVPSAITRAKIGSANTGKPVSDIERARRSRSASGSANPNYGNRTALRVEIECIRCKRQFTRRASKASPFCSSSCFYSHLSLKQRGTNNTNFQPKIAVQCPMCPAVFYVSQNTLERGYKKTCSPECGFKLLSIRAKEHHAKKRRS